MDEKDSVQMTDIGTGNKESKECLFHTFGKDSAMYWLNPSVRKNKQTLK